MKNLLLPFAVGLVSLLSTPAMAQVDTSSAAVGARNWTNNNATGSGGIQQYGLRGNTMVGRSGSYGVGLNPTWTAPQAGMSGMNHGFSSGSFNYGFQGTGFNNIGATGGAGLPTVSTGSVDANIVENTNYQLYGGSLNVPINTIPLIQPLSSIEQGLINAASSSAQIHDAVNNAINGNGP